jgi:hypothetical protein
MKLLGGSKNDLDTQTNVGKKRGGKKGAPCRQWSERIVADPTSKQTQNKMIAWGETVGFECGGAQRETQGGQKDPQNANTGQKIRAESAAG